jgi:hypothetical protein
MNKNTLIYCFGKINDVRIGILGLKDLYDFKKRYK